MDSFRDFRFSWKVIEFFHRKVSGVSLPSPDPLKNDLKLNPLPLHFDWQEMGAASWKIEAYLLCFPA